MCKLICTIILNCGRQDMTLEYFSSFRACRIYISLKTQTKFLAVLHLCRQRICLSKLNAMPITHISLVNKIHSVHWSNGLLKNSFINYLIFKSCYRKQYNYYFRFLPLSFNSWIFNLRFQVRGCLLVFHWL